MRSYFITIYLLEAVVAQINILCGAWDTAGSWYLYIYLNHININEAGRGAGAQSVNVKSRK